MKQKLEKHLSKNFEKVILTFKSYFRKQNYYIRKVGIFIGVAEILGLTHPSNYSL